MSIEKAAEMAGKWWAERLYRGNKEQFAEEIRVRVLLELQTREIVYLECDYDPQGILLEAVHAIGIECRGFLFSADGILPRKHALKVRHDRLEPKEGYGNLTDIIKVEDYEC